MISAKGGKGKSNISKVAGAKTAVKRVSSLDARELNELVLFLSTALDETVDAVLIAQDDPGFLTPRRLEDLLSLQQIAQVLAKAVAVEERS